MEVTTALQTSCDADSGCTDDVVSFVVQDGTHTLCFSKRRLMRHSPFFRVYFTVHATATSLESTDATAAPNSQVNSGTVVLKHVRAAAAEAALRLCHSRRHSDDSAFWGLLEACKGAGASPVEPRRAALREALSLYEACVKFELHRHAHAVGDAVAAAVTAATVLDVLRTCARYISALPMEVRAAIGLRTVLAACRRCIPASWEHKGDERRWRRLCAQYPELPAMLTSAAAGNDNGKCAVPPILLSPQRDDDASPRSGHLDAANTTAPPTAAATVAVASVDTPLAEVFTHHLQHTEELALAAQRRRRAVEADVVALRASGAALRARVLEDEAATAASTRYLGDARVYVQALRAAEGDMRALCTALVPVGSDASSSSTMALHALRHDLERAAELAAEKRGTVDDLLAVEEEALRHLDDELAKLRGDVC